MKYTKPFSAIALGLFATTLSFGTTTNVTFTGANELEPTNTPNNWEYIGVGFDPDLYDIKYGQLNLTGPEAIHIDILNIGAANETNATVNIDGQGAVCNVDQLHIGDNFNSINKLNVTNGAIFNVNGSQPTQIGGMVNSSVTVNIDNGSTFKVNGPLGLTPSISNFKVSNDSLLQIIGPWQIGDNNPISSQTAIINDSTVICPEVNVKNSALLQANDSNLTFGRFSFENEVELTNTRLNFYSTSINNKYLTMTNSEIINDSLTSGFNNYGVVDASGSFKVEDFTNNEYADLRVQSGKKLKITGSLANEGKIEVFDSELEVKGRYVDSAVIHNWEDGTFAISNGVVRAPDTNNDGDILFTTGQSMYFGSITNYSDARIIVSGQANVTFWDQIQQDGTFKVSAGSIATIFGDYYGDPISGFGSVYFEGQTNPGHSPGNGVNSTNTYLGLDHVLTIELGGLTPITEHDIFGSLQTLSLDGDLNVVWYDDFQASYGDTFDILEWDTLLGSFKNIDLSGAPLADYLEWDLSNLYVDGTITVIPEPATLSFLSLTAAGLLLSRRRSA
ncbi:hypothetical protein JD969_12790 [Planctomycetota bacterium]|nr:hypothetical protein JD969_12790 [Planctomycetota bacterium]